MDNVLDVKDLHTSFYTYAGEVKAVDGVSFQVAAGDAVALVGESGCGKSVTALSIMGLLQYPGRITGGGEEVQVADQVLATPEAAHQLQLLEGAGGAQHPEDPVRIR